MAASAAIPGTFTFSTAPTLAMTGLTIGSPAGPFTVSGSVTTNDPDGWTVDLSTTGPSFVNQAATTYSFPNSDVGVVGSAQLATMYSGQTCGVANGSSPKWCAQPLSSTAFPVDSMSTYSSTATALGGSLGGDEYFFQPITSGDGPFPGGSTVPNQPAGSYQDNLAYVAIPG